MKKIFQLLLTATGFSLLLSCGQKSLIEQNITPVSGARVKFYHLAPDAAGVDIYVNDNKLSGVLTVPPAAANLVTYGSSFPSQDYAVVAGGTAKIKIVTPATSTTAEIQTLATEVPLDASKFYSIYAYGTTGNYNGLVLTDDFTASDPKKAYVRFVNLVNPSSTTATPTYDLVVNGNTVQTGVGFKGSNGAFTPIDAIAYGSSALTVQAKAGTTVVSLSGGLRPYAGRFYTIIISGIMGGTTTKAPTIFASTNL